MEDGDSVRHLNYDRSTDCHQHNKLHGTWPYMHLIDVLYLCSRAQFALLNFILTKWQQNNSQF